MQTQRKLTLRRSSIDETDAYETVAHHTQVEIPKIKGSRFIADVFPATSSDDVASGRKQVADVFPDATHHCYAYSIDLGRSERSSDDGEPSGTAGSPIQRQILSSGLTNLLIVVTRYYGGTKLGAGGLIRAYGEAARAGLAGTPRTSMIIERTLEVTFNYDDTSPAMHTIDRFGAAIIGSEYGDRTKLTLRLRTSRVDEFIASMRDALRGRDETRILN